MAVLWVLTSALILRISGVLTDELCLVGDFNCQLQHILQSQTMTTQEFAHIYELLDDVRNTLNHRWPDARVFPFGSLFIGLGTKVSDVDFYVQMPNSNDSFIEDIAKLFHQHPTLYSHLSVSTAFTNPILTFYHIPTKRYCDITNESANGFETSKLLQYYFSLDQRFRTIGILLKFWLKVHDVTEYHKNLTKIRNYTLYTLIIFFLQQMEMVPSGFTLQTSLRSAEYNFINSWDLSFYKLPFSSTNIDDVYKLLGGFFKYYSDFNFQEYIVSPYIGRPIDKRRFMDVKSVPREYSLYKRLLTNHLIKPLVLDSELCIQDIFEHDNNIVDEVDREQASIFLYLVTYAAKMYNELPSDHFLGAILVPNKEKTIEGKEMDTIIQQKDSNT